MWGRKIAVALSAALDARVRELEAIEAAKPADQVRREAEATERAAQLQALFDRVPQLLRSDVSVSQFAKIAYSRCPRPAGGHVSYVRDFTVARVLERLMTETKIPGWTSRHGDYAAIEMQNSAIDPDEEIVLPLQRLAEKISPSPDEIAVEIDRAQTILLREFAKTVASIRSHFPPGELPRFFVLPALSTPRQLVVAE